MSPDVGLAEIIDLLKCSRSAAAKYTHHPEFPKPRAPSPRERGRVWDSDEVTAWAKAHLPLTPGRPPKPQAGDHYSVEP